MKESGDDKFGSVKQFGETLHNFVLFLLGYRIDQPIINRLPMIEHLFVALSFFGILWAVRLLAFLWLSLFVSPAMVSIINLLLNFDVMLIYIFIICASF